MKEVTLGQTPSWELALPSLGPPRTAEVPLPWPL